jgi:tRNA U34 5-methylaminomethyl-2-thiouridine-forming methyltransferase MnmC
MNTAAGQSGDQKYIKVDHLNFVTTADGSTTIFNAAVGENYHSKHGALQESRHVFLKSGLEFFLNQHPADDVNVLEVGLGTGLNFLLTADHCAGRHIRLHYTGIEAYPLNAEMIRQTGYHEYVSAPIWKAFIQEYEQSLVKPVPVGSWCTLMTAHTQLKEFRSDKLYDVLYFDAFAAIHQPEMWDDEALRHITGFLRPGGVFVTYAITGNLKRTMKSLGFTIEKAPGAAGKREMLRAVKKS